MSAISPSVDFENAVGQSQKPHTEPRILSSAEEDTAGKVYPPTREVVPVMVALFMALFLVSLVSTQKIRWNTFQLKY
jgi:hypothetical protein